MLNIKLELEIKELKELIIILGDNIKKIDEKMDKLENKINKLEKNINNEVLDECKKMGSHIDFVENVYENVKHPLGFISNKIKLFIGNNERYSLTNENIN